MQVRIAVGEKSHLQCVHQALDVACAGDHRRYHDYRARGLRDAVAIVHARQPARRRQQRGQPVHQHACELARDQQCRQQHQHQGCVRDGRRARRRQRARAQQPCEQHDGGQIDEQRNAARGSPQGAQHGQSHLRCTLELVSTQVDQEVANMGRPIIESEPPCALDREVDRTTRHRRLGHRTDPGYLLDHLPIAIAALLIQRRVSLCRILLQRVLDRTERLDELVPVQGAQQTQCTDAVADRDLIGGLLLITRLHQLLDAASGAGELLLQPVQRQRQRGAVPLQAAHQFGYERRGQRRIRTRHVRNRQDQVLRILPRDIAQAAGPGHRDITLRATRRDAHRDATQVLDQREAQHYGQGPQLAEREHAHRLVRGHEALEAVAIEPPITVRDGLERDVIHTRQAAGRPLGQARELLTITPRQMASGGTDLFLDEVQVVEQPLRRRSDAVLRRDRGREGRAGREQHSLVVGQAREQAIRQSLGTRAVRGCETRAILLHLIRAEQFGAQRRLIAHRAPERGVTPRARLRDDGPRSAHATRQRRVARSPGRIHDPLPSSLRATACTLAPADTPGLCGGVRPSRRNARRDASESDFRIWRLQAGRPRRPSA